MTASATVEIELSQSGTAGTILVKFRVVVVVRLQTSNSNHMKQHSETTSSAQVPTCTTVANAAAVCVDLCMQTYQNGVIKFTLLLLWYTMDLM